MKNSSSSILHYITILTLKTIVQTSSNILLLLLALIPLLFAAVFLIQQQIIRHEMKEKLEQQSLHTIALTAKDFHWMEEGKEIMVDGSMFDVHSFTQKNGTYFFTGLFDDEETALIQQFEKNNDSDSGNKTLIRFFQLLQSCYYKQQQDNIFISDASNKEFISTKMLIPAPFTSVPTPPPQI